jgi:hypothetical protein
LGIAPDISTVRFELEDIAGARFTLDIFSHASGVSVKGIFAPDGAGFAPLWRQHTDQNYWFTYIDSSRTLYFAYNVCAERTRAGQCGTFRAVARLCGDWFQRKQRGHHESRQLPVKEYRSPCRLHHLRRRPPEVGPSALPAILHDSPAVIVAGRTGSCKKGLTSRLERLKPHTIASEN